MTLKMSKLRCLEWSVALENGLDGQFRSLNHVNCTFVSKKSK